MAFIEELFPEAIAEGARGGRGWSTDLVRNRGGYEKGNQNWTIPLGVWEVGLVHKTLRETQQMQRFFHGVAKGKLHSFRFLDRKDSTIRRVSALRLTSTTYQMRQSYSIAGSGTLVLSVKKPWPDDNGLRVTLGNTEVTNYTVDSTTGILTFATAIPSGDSRVWVTGGYHIPVRFDTDRFAPEEVSQDVFSWPSIPLVEVRL